MIGQFSAWNLDDKTSLWVLSETVLTNPELSRMKNVIVKFHFMQHILIDMKGNLGKPSHGWMACTKYHTHYNVRVQNTSLSYMGPSYTFINLHQLSITIMESQTQTLFIINYNYGHHAHSFSNKEYMRSSLTIIANQWQSEHIINHHSTSPTIIYQHRLPYTSIVNNRLGSSWTIIATQWHSKHIINDQNTLPTIINYCRPRYTFTVHQRLSWIF